MNHYYAAVRKELKTLRGKEVVTTGDGMLVTFPAPAAGVQCATAIREAVRTLGLEIRAGLHVGEYKVSGPDVVGLALHIGSRVAAKARAGEVLVSSAVKDLLSESEIRFKDRGVHQLKGVPKRWRLYRVSSPDGRSVLVGVRTSIRMAAIVLREGTPHDRHHHAAHARVRRRSGPDRPAPGRMIANRWRRSAPAWTSTPCWCSATRSSPTKSSSTSPSASTARCMPAPPPRPSAANRFGNEAHGRRLQRRQGRQDPRRQQPHARLLGRQPPVAHRCVVRRSAGPLLDAVGAGGAVGAGRYRVRRHARGLRRARRGDQAPRSKGCASIIPSSIRATCWASTSTTTRRRS